MDTGSSNSPVSPVSEVRSKRTVPDPVKPSAVADGAVTVNVASLSPFCRSTFHPAGTLVIVTLSMLAYSTDFIVLVEPCATLSSLSASNLRTGADARTCTLNETGLPNVPLLLTGVTVIVPSCSAVSSFRAGAVMSTLQPSLSKTTVQPLGAVLSMLQTFESEAGIFFVWAYFMFSPSATPSRVNSTEASVTETLIERVNVILS